MKRLVFLLPLLFLGCSPKIVYIPTETIRTEIQTVHDTIVEAILDPSLDSIVTKDTLSIIDRKTARTTAKVANGMLFHTLEVKAVPIKVNFKYVTTVKHDTTTITKVQPLGKAEQFKLSNFDKVDAKSKKRASTIWKLYSVIGLLTLWTFRKLILKLIKPI